MESLVVNACDLMKEKYTAPEMEIITFENDDVITTSEPELELQ